MKRQAFLTSIAGILGGVACALILLSVGMVGTKTTTVVKQAPLQAGAPKVNASALTAGDIYRRTAPGVVHIHSRSVRSSESPFDVFPRAEENVATGSGFVLDNKGHILTNAHVVEHSTDVRVGFSDHRTVQARVVGKDLSTDLAVLKVDPAGVKLHPLELGNSDGVQVGDPILAIGNPFGLDRTLTSGLVSALQRKLKAPNGFQIENVFQTDAALNPGNSGGPVIDAGGRVIGVSSQIATAGGSGGSVGIGFAVPINTAKKIIPDLERSGRVSRAYLGISGGGIDEKLQVLNLPSRSGVLVQQIVQGGPAHRAGIRGGNRRVDIDGTPVLVGGDIIKRIDGKEIKAMDNVTAAVESHKPGDRIKIELLRDGKSKTIEVKLGERPGGPTSK